MGLRAKIDGARFHCELLEEELRRSLHIKTKWHCVRV